MSLINDHFKESSGSEEILFLEQYKHYVESAEKNSERRLKANAFFLSIHSMIVTIIGLFHANESISYNNLLVLGILGCSISLIWWIYINSFKQLNKLKFKVIHEMEKHVPFRSFTYEWELDKANTDKYLRLSTVEKTIPFYFMILYITLFALKAFDII